MPVVASSPSRAIDLSRRRGKTKRRTRSGGRGDLAASLPWKRALLLGIAVAALGAGTIVGWHAWQHGLPERLSTQIAEVEATLRGCLPFRLAEVTVEGRQYVPREALLRALDVSQGDILIAMNLADLRARLEQIDWVEHAAVERRLPGGLHIMLVERVAVAIWQRGEGDFILIDRNGRTVRASHPPPGYERLLLVGGEGAPQQIGDLFLLLASEPEIARQLTAATWVGQRRWNLYLRNGIEVRLPEEDAVAALQRLAQLNRNERLLSRDVTVVDMRLPDKLFLRRSQPDPVEADPKVAAQVSKPVAAAAAKPPATR